MMWSIRRRNLADLLRSFRERLSPQDVGLPSIGRRRVKGLRREEVAALTGVGLTWYTQLEAAAEINVSRTTLIKIGRALRCSAAEQATIMRLAFPEVATNEGSERVDLTTRKIVDAIQYPAFILDGYWYVRYWNSMFAALWDTQPRGSEAFHAIEYQVTRARDSGFQGETWEARTRRMIAQFRYDSAVHTGEPAFDELVQRLQAIPVFSDIFEQREIITSTDETAGVVEHPELGHVEYEIRSLVMSDSELTLTIQVVDPKTVLRLRRESR